MSSKSLDTYKAAEEKRLRERQAAEQNSLFREVDDDLWHDQLLALWKRYGMWVAAAAVAVVLAVAGYQIYRGMQDSERAEQGATFDQAEAALVSHDVAKAVSLLSALEAKGNSGYRTLARLQHAAVLVDQGKRAEARDVMKAVAGDAKALPA
ncbi:MAG: tetratricopeptide repeat protein, partial [Rhodospirillaceae bacterium]|nr:tetratricopeptide repeat protein [Rhodospirillaceae bacterium]